MLGDSVTNNWSKLLHFITLDVRFEVLTAVHMSIKVLCDVKSRRHV